MPKQLETHKKYKKTNKLFSKAKPAINTYKTHKKTVQQSQDSYKHIQNTHKKLFSKAKTAGAVGGISMMLVACLYYLQVG